METKPHAPRICLPFDATLADASSKAVEALGRVDFFECMFDLLGTVCAADSGGVMMFFRNQRPNRLLHRFNLAERSLPEDFYLSGPYALDPLYQKFLKGGTSGIYWLHEFVPDDFFKSEYYRIFYSQIGLSDEINVLWRIDENSALVFFLERSMRNPAFQSADIISLNLLLRLVFSVCAKHYQLRAAEARQNTDDLAHRKVQSTIENFARSQLTHREREVLFHMLQGFSSNSTAARLSITEGTVKIHRKNIHRKLAIGSQAELFSLFINCIPYALPDKPIDPLEVYQNTLAKQRSPCARNGTADTRGGCSDIPMRIVPSSWAERSLENQRLGFGKTWNR